MEIRRFQKEYVAEAAQLFCENYRRQRSDAPELPAHLADPSNVQEMLSRCFSPETGIVALNEGRLAGYLTWFVVDRFREAGRRGAYVPEWGHAALSAESTRIYQALYRAAGEDWCRADCQVHAITLLAVDEPAAHAWYWNGFGLTVVDAIRPMKPLGVSAPAGFTIRKAVPGDAKAIASIDREHWSHYARSPIFMVPQTARSAADNVRFLSQDGNSIWLALDGGQIEGFLRCSGSDFDGAAILESDEGITITGAYVRPAYRGQGIASGLLDAVLHDYEAQGRRYCAVNFESFNPEAVSFWMKYFQPVCHSLLRVPEANPVHD